MLPPAVTGRPGLLAARPETCRVSTAPHLVSGLAVRGTVRRIVPLGGGTRVDVDTPAGTLACLGPGGDGLEPGRAVVVTVAETDVRALETDDLAPATRGDPAGVGRSG
ncbi:TOBE domain-containing protein [Pseudonocardia xinjiangensis]|uniref:TOBE domain-containing protein n=1 Tax=Pseudonocardia xinjiangensis TaxID=75289 RepID=UPI003D8FAD21